MRSLTTDYLTVTTCIHWRGGISHCTPVLNAFPSTDAKRISLLATHWSLLLYLHAMWGALTPVQSHWPSCLRYDRVSFWDTALSLLNVFYAVV